MDPYHPCRLCPRSCSVNRRAGERGFCGETAALRLASASIHRGEEPPITGKGGSGTIFVSGCNLGCAFCQNHQISQGGLGREVTMEEFVSICRALQDRGAENINIVTGSHAAPALAAGVTLAREGGVSLPICWNSSGYENLQALSLLEGLADWYLPDLKTLDQDLAARFFGAPDYPEAAARAIRWMIRARPGRVIVRHLALPGHLDSTREVLRWFGDHQEGAVLSLMTQYTPVQTGRPIPGRFLSPGEYETILRWLEEFGIDEGFCQEPFPGDEWLPDFRRPNPFSSDLSLPVWHYRD